MTPILCPGATVWRVEKASRVALLIDDQAYFVALKAAINRAKRSVLIIGWIFDPRTELETSGETIGSERS